MALPVSTVGKVQSSGTLNAPFWCVLRARHPCLVLFRRMSVSTSPSISLLPRPGQRTAYWRAPSSITALAWFVAEAARQRTGPLLVIAPDNQSAHQIELDLSTLLTEQDDLPVTAFPDWETLPYDLFSPHPEIVSQRLAALHCLPRMRHGILVVAVHTLMQHVIPKGYLQGASFVLNIGQQLNLSAEQERLQSAGYRHVPHTIDPGEFACRGGLLDVFPMGTQSPLRIELLDDRIESIRHFDPESQRSFEPVDSVRILPGREVPLDAERIDAVLTQLRERFDLDTRRSPLYQDLKAGIIPAGIEYYQPLFFADQQNHPNATLSTLFDYLDESALIVSLEGIDTAAETFWQQTQERYNQRCHDIQRPILPPDALYDTPNQLRETVNRFRQIRLCTTDHPRFSHAMTLGETRLAPLPLSKPKNSPDATTLKEFLASYAGRVLIAADSPGRREALHDLLRGVDLAPVVLTNFAEFLAQPPIRLGLTVAQLDEGFALTQPPIAVVTERQLFPERANLRRSRRRASKEPESIIRDLNELAEGAPIVHEDHGVGRYRGLNAMEICGTTGDFLVIEYAKGDRLYVPVTQLHLISRYSGASAETAPLHSLGGEQWIKTKHKAAEKIRDVAVELLDIQARRQAQVGLAIPLDRSMYEPFAAQFPFEETPDQIAAIDATLHDLTKNQPMDRVICGDVGFGKTEVALRAAFATACAGKQVALLVPTTLLAEQHYRNFRDRLADWPIRVEVLSRFKRPKEITVALTKVAEGLTDVIIGTHRLLQADVRFKDLGLVIVDEEQRFGVRQKEALKALRANVHLLTLTATPIPRTLNMAMSGLRDLSIIATPPPNRLAVQTTISAWDDALIKEAFQRELSRGGQLYFLHNDVQTIARMERQLAELVPNARIGVAHGQMPERTLERVMLDFQKQRFNVLLATTIIESGIDIPNANTIIIHRADRFGLAQLHQLRGRVGRSHHRAYAYLLVETKTMTADAQKRIDAIASMDELGAGFMLSTHDLEIRGAGELLGEDQSGQMAEIGFSLYTQLLERAVASIRNGTLATIDLEKSTHDADVQLHLPAVIPEEYIPDVHTRLTLYKRISSARETAQLRDLQIEMIDRFGLLPEAAKHLFSVAELKLHATALGIRKIDLGGQHGRIDFVEVPRIDPISLIQLIQRQPLHYAMDGPQTVRIKRELPQATDRIQAVRALLTLLEQSPSEQRQTVH